MSSQDAAGTIPEQPTTVLVADDDFLLARHLEADLRELGFNVVGLAPTGQAAIDLAKQHRPDMALLDIRMPVLDGLAAAEVLFGQLGVPVVILSAYSDPPYLETGAEVGVFGYLLKPVTRDELRVTLTVAWGRFCEHRRLTDEVGALKLKLEQRKTIEKAKGVLMVEHGIGENEAMRVLQKQARDARRPMADVAADLLAASEDRGQLPRRPPGKPKERPT